MSGIFRYFKTGWQTLAKKLVYQGRSDLLFSMSKYF